MNTTIEMPADQVSHLTRVRQDPHIKYEIKKREYHARIIRDMPWLVGIARDRETPTCATHRLVKGVDGEYYDDYAVYEGMSLNEVINSFKADDGIAAVNALYLRDSWDVARKLEEWDEPTAEERQEWLEFFGDL